MRAAITIVAAATLLLSACAPALRTIPAGAQVQAPSAWSVQASSATMPMAARWWEGFGNAELSRHVEAALAYNANLQVAGARVAAARAQLAQAEGALLPVLNATMVADASHTLTAAGIGTSRIIEPQLQASWEPDLWGRLSDKKGAVEWQLRASQAERDAVALSVAASTAQAYIDLLAREAQLIQARKTADLRLQSLELVRDQQAHGYISRLQLTQAEAEYESVRQQIPALQLAISRQRNALQLLTGELPSSGADRDADDAIGGAALAGQFNALTLPAVPGMLPSELLTRRPDLAQAAAQLAASDAALRASRAAFLPSVRLSASLGGLYANALHYDPIRIWDLGGSVLAPLFDGHRLEAEYDAATAQRDQAAYAYRGAALNAFTEVENALVGTLRLQEQLDGAQRRSEVLTRSFGYARDRYEAGYASYLEQLDAQRNQFQAELEVINLRQSQFQNLIALYKALGGGWSAASALEG
ncbi:efflux transporter outer membrane subunit [Ottowia sp. VDI28]|uniref:efflux transporter outer membrane subunit n=1 Tax=Ottowia sp. VDI28 TaxID=3133968 RepID=UPI003C2BFB4B